MRKNITLRAYQESIKLLNSVSEKTGFVASAINIDNYHRVFARDGIIAAIAAFLTEDKKLIEVGKKTIQTLAKYQDGTGRIASNISHDGKKVSYGTQVGRIDSTIWFIIGIGQYVKRTKDYKFAKNIYKSAKKAMDYLSAIETNGRGLLYIPYGGDWADEYLNHGYVLFDELLYLQAQRDFAFLLKTLRMKNTNETKKAKFLERQILMNFIPRLTDFQDQAIYQRSESFTKLIKTFKKPYAIAYFVQGDIGEYFDAFANALLLSLVRLPEGFKRDLIKHCLTLLKKQRIDILPAFDPVIVKHGDEKNNYRWKILQFSYLFRYKNKPYHYHNGGLWPLIQGFFIASIFENGKKEEAKDLIEKLANIFNDEKFRFSEYFDGKHGMPQGTEFLSYSASAYIIAYEAVFNGKKFFI